MTSPADAADLLTLHAVRLRGFAEADVLARRFDRDPQDTHERLQDHESLGHVAHTEFAGLAGWSLTDRGRRHGEQLLAAERNGTPGADDAVRAAHAAFLPLNARLRSAVTDWQLRPGRAAAVLVELDALAQALVPLDRRLADALPRFGGYATRFAAALARARAGEPGWVDGTGLDSCHTVWFELHEDLIATLGLTRDGTA
jgi:hypothetical protein